MSVATFPDAARIRTAAFSGYRPGGDAATPAGKLSSNEAAFGPAPGVAEAVAEAVREGHRYPDASALVAMIAAQESVAADQVVVTNGSDELCYLLASLFVAPGDAVVLSDPCYQIHGLVTQLYGGRAEFVALRPDGGHDLEAMSARTNDAALLWLPTPHNPTGVAVDPSELQHFLDAVPPTCLVVLDEAYRAYVDADRRPDVPALLGHHPNLMVQRTFSKDYALAGLRVGYGIGAQELVEAINRVKPPFNVNAAAIAAAEVALRQQGWRDYGVTIAIRERRRLEAHLEALGATYFPSQANFVTVAVPDTERAIAALGDVGVVVRNGADLGLPGWVRVSVGTPPVMAQLRAVLEEVL
jgi:histidinol-phosphate aminotransferase